MELEFKPVTADCWQDFEVLFGQRGGPNYCWCMLWRATAEEGRSTKGPARKEQMRTRICENIPVGLIAYRDDQPLAWVSIAPRDTYRRLGGPEAQSDQNIWSLTCMYAHKSVRKQGIAHALIAAATTHAFAHGATIVEAYPVASDAPSYRFMGFVPAFEKAGFSFVEMAGKRRHVMRRCRD